MAHLHFAYGNDNEAGNDPRHIGPLVIRLYRHFRAEELRRMVSDDPLDFRDNNRHTMGNSEVVSPPKGEL